MLVSGSLLADVPLRYYEFAKWDIARGLPQVSVQGLAQDPDGYIWMGTQAGLARFDGIRFRVYDTSNSQLTHHFVHSLMSDSQGRIWVGTMGGVNRWVGGEISEPLKTAQGGSPVRGFEELADGRVAAASYGLPVYNDGGSVTYPSG